MKIFKNKKSLINEISGLKNLSFIPTMGVLHKGHEYLIKKAKLKKGKTLVSIYVNPKQFNSNEDYTSYPKNLRSDLSRLKKLKIDYLYIPNYNDIFLFKTRNNIFKDRFIKKLCGKYRKYHFEGVLNVINRFLEIIKPKYLILGKKDFQQLHLIKKHIEHNNINTKIIACNTMRMNNGLAFSSRNKNLNSKDIVRASKVFNVLKKYKYSIKKNKIKNFNLNLIKKNIIDLGIKKIDYIECLNTKNFKNTSSYTSEFNIFIAFYIGKTRLIDNV